MILLSNYQCQYTGVRHARASLPKMREPPNGVKICSSTIGIESSHVQKWLNDSDWIKDKPGAINTLKDIATGKETAPEEESASKLENKDLVRQGQLTMMGLLVYRRLQECAQRLVNGLYGRSAVWPVARPLWKPLRC